MPSSGRGGGAGWRPSDDAAANCTTSPGLLIASAPPADPRSGTAGAADARRNDDEEIIERCRSTLEIGTLAISNYFETLSLRAATQRQEDWAADLTQRWDGVEERLDTPHAARCDLRNALVMLEREFSELLREMQRLTFLQRPPLKWEETRGAASIC